MIKNSFSTFTFSRRFYPKRLETENIQLARSVFQIVCMCVCVRVYKNKTFIHVDPALWTLGTWNVSHTSVSRPWVQGGSTERPPSRCFMRWIAGQSPCWKVVYLEATPQPTSPPARASCMSFLSNPVPGLSIKKTQGNLWVVKEICSAGFPSWKMAFCSQACLTYFQRPDKLGFMKPGFIFAHCNTSVGSGCMGHVEGGGGEQSVKRLCLTRLPPLCPPPWL